LINEFICDITVRNVSAFVANLPALWLLVLQLRKKYQSYTAKSRRTRNGYNSSIVHLTDLKHSGDGVMISKTEAIGGGNSSSCDKGPELWFECINGGSSLTSEQGGHDDDDDVPVRVRPQYSGQDVPVIRVDTELNVQGELWSNVKALNNDGSNF
jgi:hypothetical protein